ILSSLHGRTLEVEARDCGNGNMRTACSMVCPNKLAGDSTLVGKRMGELEFLACIAGLQAHASGIWKPSEVLCLEIE
ncbi:hypothetical protein P7K49_035467, partial [Saguinus oedipus]